MPPPVPSRSSFGNPQWKMGTSPPAFGSRYSPDESGTGLRAPGELKEGPQCRYLSVRQKHTTHTNTAEAPQSYSSPRVRGARKFQTSPNLARPRGRNKTGEMRRPEGFG